MVRKAALRNSADRVIKYINEYVTLAGPEKKEEVLALFDSMHQLFPHWVIMTCPVMHPGIRYVSKNSTYIFGYSIDHLIQNSSPERYFSMVHDADQQDLLDCFSFIHDHLEMIPPDEHHVYRNIYHYRLQKADGRYMYLHDEKAVLSFNDSENLYYTLFRDVTAEKTFTGVKAEVFKQEEVLHKIKEYKPAAERNPLSKREGELVTLIKQGLSTKEIAWYLKISHNTVRNIKSKMFEKFNVSSTIELLNITA
jgi:DNA-binding CsgD family transcriptional regulator